MIGTLYIHIAESRRGFAKLKLSRKSLELSVGGLIYSMLLCMVAGASSLILEWQSRELLTVEYIVEPSFGDVRVFFKETCWVRELNRTE